MSGGNVIQPSWLRKLLKVRFYKDCRIEGHPKRTIFCFSCVSGPICEICARLHHGDHQTLRVFKASHGVAIRVGDISRRVNQVGIQPFSINSNSIFFLHSRGKSSLPRTPKCDACEGHLKSSQYAYCSIACKVGFLPRRPVHNNYGVDHQSDVAALKMTTFPVNDDSKETEFTFSYRTRRRKGMPHRSPLK